MANCLGLDHQGVEVLPGDYVRCRKLECLGRQTVVLREGEKACIHVQQAAERGDWGGVEVKFRANGDAPAPDRVALRKSHNGIDVRPGDTIRCRAEECMYPLTLSEGVEGCDHVRRALVSGDWSGVDMISRPVTGSVPHHSDAHAEEFRAAFAGSVVGVDVPKVGFIVREITPDRSPETLAAAPIIARDIRGPFAAFDRDVRAVVAEEAPSVTVVTDYCPAVRDFLRDQAGPEFVAWLDFHDGRDRAKWFCPIAEPLDREALRDGIRKRLVKIGAKAMGKRC